MRRQNISYAVFLVLAGTLSTRAQVCTYLYQNTCNYSDYVLQVCNVPGSCEGIVIGTLFGVSTYQDCLTKCKAVEDCKWLTVDTGLEYCNLLASCDYLNTEVCQSCASGMRLIHSARPTSKIIIYIYNILGESTCPHLQCNVKGQCLGSFLQADLADTNDMCRRRCAATPDCRHYTYDYDTALCQLYETCNETSSASCDRCFSGEPGCEIGKQQCREIRSMNGTNSTPLSRSVPNGYRRSPY